MKKQVKSEMNEKCSVVVKWYDPAKGYGFAMSQASDLTFGQQDVYIHATKIIDNKSLLAGDVFTCDVVSKFMAGGERFFAVNVAGGNGEKKMSESEFQNSRYFKKKISKQEQQLKEIACNSSAYFRSLDERVSYLEEAQE